MTTRNKNLSAYTFTRDEIGRAIIVAAVEEMNAKKEPKDRVRLPDLWVPKWEGFLVDGELHVTVIAKIIDARAAVD